MSRLTWFSIARRLTPNWAAMAMFDLPSAMSWSTRVW
jgi:hypothetical protein